MYWSTLIQGYFYPSLIYIVVWLQNSNAILPGDWIFSDGDDWIIQRLAGLFKLPDTGGCFKYDIPTRVRFFSIHSHHRFFLIILQVVFKCCKLIPVLIGGVLIQGAIAMCMDCVD